jgi:hypothetical protein
VLCKSKGKKKHQKMLTTAAAAVCPSICLLIHPNHPRGKQDQKSKNQSNHPRNPVQSSFRAKPNASNPYVCVVSF